MKMKSIMVCAWLAPALLASGWPSFAQGSGFRQFAAFPTRTREQLIGFVVALLKFAEGLVAGSRGQAQLLQHQRKHFGAQPAADHREGDRAQLVEDKNARKRDEARQKQRRPVKHEAGYAAWLRENSRKTSRGQS